MGEGDGARGEEEEVGEEEWDSEGRDELHGCADGGAEGVG